MLEVKQNCFVFSLVLLLNVCLVYGGSSTLRCYTCDLFETSACDDPAVTAVLPSVECKEPPPMINPRLSDGQSVADFVLSRTSNGQFSGAPVISDILLRETQTSDVLTDAEYTFYCGKLVLVSGESESIQRRCVPVKKDISNVCDFIKEELDEKMSLKNCNLCDTDLCNSSSDILASTIIIALLVCLSLLFA